MLCSTRNPTSGTTLIEATIAAGIAAIFLGSLFTLNTSSMGTIKMAREAAAASQVLQQRIEAMRIANWHQITDADWIKNNLLNASANGSVDLKSVNEILTIAPYGSANTAVTRISRTGNTATIDLENDNLLTENAIKVTWTVNYIGAPNDRSMTRQTVAILAKGGVAK